MIGMLVLLDFVVVGVLIMLQFLVYGFLPAIDPKTVAKSDAALEVIYQTNIPLVLGTLIGVGVLYPLNRIILKKSTLADQSRWKINLLALLIVFGTALTFLIRFSLNYYSANTD